MSVSAPVHHTHAAAPAVSKPKVVKGYIPAGHTPKPVIMPDYIAWVPASQSDRKRTQGYFMTLICFDKSSHPCVLSFPAVNIQPFEPTSSGTNIKPCLMTSIRSIKSSMQKFKWYWRSLMKWMLWCRIYRTTPPITWSVDIHFYDFLCPLWLLL